jgi:hypothetical protein
VGAGFGVAQNRLNQRKGAMIRFELALVMLALTLVAAKAKPIILIDHEWNVRYAKFACEKAKEVCAEDPTLAVHIFEARITAAMALSTKCEGVEVVNGRKINNPTSEPIWFLKIDDWELGKTKQPWSLNLAKRAASL